MKSIQFTLPFAQEYILLKLSKGYSTAVSLVDAVFSTYNLHAQEVPSSNLVYAIFQHNNQSVGLHRLIMSRILGRSLETKELVDHIDGDGLNNRRDNLRISNHDQNMKNRKLNVNNVSGYKGVYFHRQSQKWRSEIYADNKRICLGAFNSSLEAHEAYCKAAVVYHKEFSRLK